MFRARSGFAQTKPDDVENAGLFATQIIIFVYCRPRDALTAEVLSNVVRQLCSHTVVVVEQVANPLARAQFFLQAAASVVIVPVAPPAPEPPVGVVPPEALEPPVAAPPPVPDLPPPPGLPPVPELPPVAPLVPPVEVVEGLLLLQAPM